MTASPRAFLLCRPFAPASDILAIAASFEKKMALDDANPLAFQHIFLGSVNALASTESSSTSSPSLPPGVEPVDSDFVVILAAFLYALIFVLGLVVVARCAWIRRISGGGRSSLPPLTNKGLKKKVLWLLPKATFTAAEHVGKLADCAICLAEFTAGDEIRVLLQCGHGFYVGCIDMWLRSHSSCPSCQKILVIARCQRCGELLANSAAGAEADVGAREREDFNVNAFLP
ncbi:RING-H2 finger protein ATL80-like [Malania oleifera]|uniref:RING-H2 finger protein ATL80-like n=1 Tax=Malania oleifera TaxID=397392 RepID=UPI0025ADC266|nr:RING-H2 finger protein ATL80-like [Malania oleifera]